MELGHHVVRRAPVTYKLFPEAIRHLIGLQSSYHLPHLDSSMAAWPARSRGLSAAGRPKSTAGVAPRPRRLDDLKNSRIYEAYRRSQAVSLAEQGLPVTLIAGFRLAGQLGSSSAAEAVRSCERSRRHGRAFLLRCLFVGRIVQIRREFRASSNRRTMSG